MDPSNDSEGKLSLIDQKPEITHNYTNTDQITRQIKLRFPHFSSSQ